jgi:MFS family permease
MRYLLASTFIVSLSMGIVGLALPLYARDLGASYTEVGLLGTTYVVLNILFSPLSGRVADRRGRKPFLVLGLLLVACSFALYPLIKAVWWLLLIRLLQGAAEAPIWVNAQAAVADLSEDGKRGRAMGTYGTSWAFGFVIGPFLGGYLYDRFGFVPPFASGAALALVASFVMLATSLPKPQILPGKLKFSELQPACFLGFIHVGVVSVIFLIFSVYLLNWYNPTQIGGLLALFGIVRGLLFIPLGSLSDKHGPGRIIEFGLFGLAVGSVGLIFTTDYSLLALVILILAAAEGSIYPAVMSIVSKIGGQTSAYVLGIFNGVAMLGWGVLPPIGGFLADAVGPTLPYFMCALISSGALIMARKLFARK